MSIRLLTAIAATGSSLSIAVFKTNGQITPSTLRTKDLLAGGKPVTVVCFGDSITGVYYPTGGRRA